MAVLSLPLSPEASPRIMIHNRPVLVRTQYFRIVAGCFLVVAYLLNMSKQLGLASLSLSSLESAVAGVPAHAIHWQEDEEDRGNAVDSNHTAVEQQASQPQELQPVDVDVAVTHQQQQEGEENEVKSTAAAERKTQQPRPQPHPKVELFRDRLDRLLPPTCVSLLSRNLSVPTCTTEEADNKHRLFPADIAKLERELLTFHVTRPVVVDYKPRAGYVSIQMWNWKNLVDAKRQHPWCPNCQLRHPSNNTGMNGTSLNEMKRNPGEVKTDEGCPRGLDPMFQDYPGQLLLAGCGESQVGSGLRYVKGRKQFDFESSFENRGPFYRTYAHLHLVPPEPRYNFTAVHSVAELAAILLRPPPARGAGEYEAAFIHGACGHKRGSLVRKIIKSKVLRIAAYGTCFTNQANQYHPDHFYFSDNEATRDGLKTVLSSFHNFTFALENTLSEDYFTEKRYQVLIAGSVPIVWNNHNSLDYLPDPDAALLVDPRHDEAENARQIEAIVTNETEYAKFFEWKKRGLRASFVRKLFLSTDFVTCRLCEYMANNYPAPQL